MLRDYLIDISITKVKQSSYFRFSHSPELFGAGLYKEEMLTERFSTSHKRFKNFAISRSCQRQLTLCCDQMGKEKAGSSITTLSLILVSGFS